ncbi:hypothetical protein MTO96_023050 [Rhipicephalus appendiculatus]
MGIRKSFETRGDTSPVVVLAAQRDPYLPVLIATCDAEAVCWTFQTAVFKIINHIHYPKPRYLQFKGTWHTAHMKCRPSFCTNTAVSCRLMQLHVLKRRCFELLF